MDYFFRCPWATFLGDIWNASGIGDFLTRLEAFRRPFSARLCLLPQERDLRYSLTLFRRGNRDLSYNINWHKFPQVMGPPEHRLVSDLKYSHRIYPRNSQPNPTGGFEVLSATQICSFSPEPESYGVIRQGVGLNQTIPLGFCGASLKLWGSAGVLFSFPTQGFRERFLAEPRRVLRDIRANGEWDLALCASADLFFDLPLKVLRDAGIRGHVSGYTNVRHDLTEIRRRGFSLQTMRNSLQRDVGVGVVIPTPLSPMEVTFIHTFARGPNPSKSGIEFKVSRK